MNRATTAVSLMPLLLALGACSSIKTPGVPINPWLSAAPCASSTCGQKEAIAAIAVAQNYCIELREYYERGGQVTGSQRLFVGILGSFAGSVFAVTAGGTAAKAWSGLSGATNGIQTQIDQARNRPGGPEVIEKIANEQIAASVEMKKLLSSASTSPDWAKLVTEAVMLPDRCSAAAGLGLAKAANASAAAASAAAAAERAASAAEKLVNNMSASAGTSSNPK